LFNIIKSREKTIMKTAFIGAAAAAALALTGLSAHGACVDPRVAAGTAPAHSVSGVTLPRTFIAESDRGGPVSIVGTWLVSYTLGGEAIIQWHSDGTEWENITNPVLGGNICLGRWEQTGWYTYARHHMGWIYEVAGAPASNYFIEDETVKLATDGRSYTGTDTFTIYNMDGTVQEGPLSGTAAATRF
jgi:hypothetical protein